MYLLHIIILVLQSSVFGVRIGVSKLSTTSTTTLAPNISIEDINATITLSATVTTTSEIETSTSATVSKDFSSTTVQFPPKVAQPTTKTTATTPKTTTTPLPSSSTPVTVNSTANVTNFPDPDPARAYLTNFYCYCDLNPSVCDLNCCCDRDCPKKILKVFNCFSPSKYPELRLRLEDFQYEHGLPSCKINDGWLCVFRTNTRPPIEKVHQFDFDTAHRYKWPSSLLDMTGTSESKERDFYKFGEQLKVINMENLEVKNFEIPYSFKPPHCQVSDSIRHLILVSRNCLLTSLTAAQETKRKFMNFVATTKLLSKPREQLIDSKDQKYLTRDFTVKSCILNNKGEENDCSELDTLYNETELNESENYYVKEIRIKVWHNFTNLQGCLIEFVEQELFPNDGPLELWQKYSVSFIATNVTEPDHSVNKIRKDSQISFSGPLGYLHGEPIIVSKFVPNNESEELSPQNRVLNYFKSRNLLNNTLNLLSRQEGFCHKNYDKDSSINYGISSLTQCMLRIDKKYLTKFNSRSLNKLNFTDICVQLQQQIIETLFGVHVTNQLNELGELYISVLGHPQNSSGKWLPLHIENLDFSPIVGQLTVDYQTLICRNILLNAAYEFHIGTFTEKGINQQALLKNAVLKLGQRHDLEFSLDEPLEVPLALTVMFYDLSLNIGPLMLGGSGFLYGVLTLVCLKFVDFIFHD